MYNFDRLARLGCSCIAWMRFKSKLYNYVIPHLRMMRFNGDKVRYEDETRKEKHLETNQWKGSRKIAIIMTNKHVMKY